MSLVPILFLFFLPFLKQQTSIFLVRHTGIPWLCTLWYGLVLDPTAADRLTLDLDLVRRHGLNFNLLLLLEHVVV
jgi:hypothetical protein